MSAEIALFVGQNLSVCRTKRAVHPGIGIQLRKPKNVKMPPIRTFLSVLLSFPTLEVSTRASLQVIGRKVPL